MTDEKPKYTPGPWTALTDKPRLTDCGGVDRCEILVCVGPEQSRGNPVANVVLGGPGALHPTQAAVEPNARLIAAAPDMAKALKEWHDLTRRFLDSPGESYDEMAQEFYRDTGYLAPGKDAPMALANQSHDERRDAWKKWNDAKLADRMGRTAAALRKAGVLDE